MAAEGKIKTSYDFTPEIKDKLGRLKLDLRLRGITGVSETSILEALVAAVSVKDAEAKVRELQETLHAHRSMMLRGAAVLKAEREEKAPKKPRRRR